MIAMLVMYLILLYKTFDLFSGFFYSKRHGEGEVKVTWLISVVVASAGASASLVINYVSVSVDFQVILIMLSNLLSAFIIYGAYKYRFKDEVTA